MELDTIYSSDMVWSPRHTLPITSVVPLRPERQNRKPCEQCHERKQKYLCTEHGSCFECCTECWARPVLRRQ